MCALCREKSAKHVADQRQRIRDVNAKFSITGIMACRTCSVRQSAEHFIDEKTDRKYERCKVCREKDLKYGAQRTKRVRTENAKTTNGTKTCLSCYQTYQIEKFMNIKGIDCLICTECRKKGSIHKRLTVNGKIGVYKAAAKKQRINWHLSKEECMVLFNGNCTYCDFPGNIAGLNGIDRLDSNSGYIESNVVSCCFQCNTSKNTLDPKTFVLRCIHIQAVFENKNGMYVDLWPKKTPGAYSRYKEGAKKRKYVFEMTKEQYLDLIEKPCVYCHRAITDTNKSGIDRRDPTKGYVNGNIDSCCSECNFMKGPMTVEEFKDMVTRIATDAQTILGKIPADIPCCLNSLTRFRKKQ